MVLQDGKISYAEFKAMMKTGMDWRMGSRQYSRAKLNVLSMKMFGQSRRMGFSGPLNQPQVRQVGYSGPLGPSPLGNGAPGKPRPLDRAMSKRQ